VTAFPDAALRVTEIFHSLQGESTRVGLPTVFVRLTGCPLRCVWCDTAYAFAGGESLAIEAILARVARIVDLKAPDSGEAARNRWENLAALTPHDELKLVLASERDYEWAKRTLRERRLDALCPVLFSPVHGRLDPAELAAWILRDRLPVRFQLQLHKLLWGDARGR
jgi:7-carboxy-7-deazaguanine synthase